MRPHIGITLGDPRGIGPEVVARALAREEIRALADFTVFGAADWAAPPGVAFRSVGRWNVGRDAAEAGSEAEAGRLSAAAIDRGIAAALSGEIDGLVTGPISKRALAAAGSPYHGHTELLRDRAGVPDVAMLMAAERTPLGGPLRLALLTVHVPLREVPGRLEPGLVVRRTRIAVEALRDWWGIPTPRICFAGVNPHASEGGLFGDEEATVLEPAVRALAADPRLEILGIVPADTAFRLCVDGTVDLVVAPYHDVGLAVIKTVARDTGVNVTAGLPFPRTAPDHGTAFDIAGRGLADPGATCAAIELCARFAARARRAGAAPGGREPSIPAGAR